MNWILDWSHVIGEADYVVFPINQYGDRIALGQTCGWYKGWWVKQVLRKKCYAVLPVPPFEFTKEELFPLIVEEKP